MIANALAIFIGIALGITLDQVAVPVGILIVVALMIGTKIMEAHDRRDHRSTPPATARQIRAARPAIRLMRVIDVRFRRVIAAIGDKRVVVHFEAPT